MIVHSEKLSITSEVRNISFVEKMVDDLSSAYKIDSDLYGKMLLAVVEGVNNAVVHGNKLDKSKTVTVEYSIINDSLYFHISDQGNGFDYTAVPDPTTPENIEKPHGRGIFLMYHLADGIEFKNNGSEVRLMFKL
jgi:serine/threonine-protein kinase RsbW